MPEWRVETEDEVAEWLLSLPDGDLALAKGKVALLREHGSSLRGPHSRPLGNGLFELRFDMNRQAWRISYCFDANRVIVLLTVFRKQRDNERREVERARQAMRRAKGGERDGTQGV